MDTTKSKAPGGDAPPEAPAKRAAEGARRQGHATTYSASTSPPCGACKFLRRKCIGGCIFAPHFGMDQGAARFAAVHKVFGASNVSKLLQNVPIGRRSDAVVTICYEAQARLSDPVYGCVSTILALQQQVSTLQAEFSVVQSQLIHNRWVAAGAIQGSEQPHLITTTLQPAFSNNSSTCNNLAPTSTRPDTTQIFQPLQLSQPSKCDEEEESRNTVDFANGVFDSK